VKDAKEAAQLQQDHFFVVNYAALSKEMAQGSGQYFASLTKLLGCPVSVQGQLAQISQKNYEDVFAKPGPLAALDEFKEKLQADDQLVQDCHYL